MEYPEPASPPRVNAAEWRWVVVFAALVMLVTSLPYLVGFAAQGSGWRFSGFVFGVEDGNSYIAKMRTGSAGAWLFRTPYTTSPQGGVVAFLPYLLLGKLLGPLSDHIYFVGLFHAFRLLAGFVCVLATYGFIAGFLPSLRGRRLALILAILGGGLGWALVLTGQTGLLGSLPLEFYSPETFGFLSLYGIPHLALGRAALMWGLQAHLKIAQPGRVLAPREALQLGVAWILAALAQPLQAVILGYVIALHLVLLVLQSLRWRTPGSPYAWSNWFRIGIGEALSGLPAIAFVVYTLVAFSTDPYLQAWTAQNIIRSPHPLHYLLAYGLILPFALPGALHLLRQAPGKSLLLAGWALSLPFLAYLPFNLQRRLPEGVWVALAILALAQLEAPTSVEGPALTRRIRPILRALYLTLLFPSTLILIAGGALAAASPNMPLFIPAAETAAFEFLAHTAAPGSVVLSTYASGNALPAWAPVRVVIGHGPESVGLEDLQPRVNGFYQAMEPALAVEFLREQGVDYVFFEPIDSSRENIPIQDQLPGMEKIYERSGYRIFRVKEPAP